MTIFQIITLFPEYFESPLKQGLLSQAVEKGLVKFVFVNPRDFATNPTKRVDDEPFSGGGGMVLCYEPLKRSIDSLSSKGHAICLTPKGSLWTSQKAKNLVSQHTIITLICGRYEGFDERFIQDFANEEISVGDYVLNGGEVAALSVIESSARFIFGFLGNKNSVQQESFENNYLLESPQWTRPQSIGNYKIPAVLLSGHHKKIEEFKLQVSIVITALKRPDLFEKSSYSQRELKKANGVLLQLSDKELLSLGISKEDLSDS